MATALMVLVPVLIGIAVLAFYMDWLGLWISKEDMKDQIRKSKESMQKLEKQSGNGAPAKDALCQQADGTESICKAIAFDVDTASLKSLREALPGWTIEQVNGATAASISYDWNPGAASLLVVSAQKVAAETLGLCRFLASCSRYSKDFRQEPLGTPVGHKNGKKPETRNDAPLLVLVRQGQETLVEAALEAGAHSCLMLPIHAKDVANMLIHARVGNQPGRHTLNLETAQNDDRWRDDGGQD